MIQRLTAGGWETVLSPAPLNADPAPEPTAERPYHSETYAITPTADDTGSVVHPGVVDMGESGWQGWRFWMAASGYWLESDRNENPHVLVSADGQTWQAPAGLVNPLLEAPPVPRFHSDPDIEYDVENDRMVVINRTSQEDATQQTFISVSDDGVTWSTFTALNWTRPGGTGQVLSPSIVRRGPGDWWLFGLDRTTFALYHYRASDPTGAWTGPTSLGRPTLNDADTYPWHLDVTWDGEAFRAIADVGPRYLGRPDGLRAGTINAAGTQQIWAADNFLDLRQTGWDTTELYRAALVPHEDGQHFRVWYSANGFESWRVGLTLVPRAEWPEIGDTITFPTPTPDPPLPQYPPDPWTPATFQQAVLDLGAEGYWKLDETSGVRIFDHSGHDRHGVIAGTAGHSYILGDLDGHVRFLAKSGFVQIPDSDAFSPGLDGLTVFASVNATQSGSYYRIVAKHVENFGEWGMYAQSTSLAGGYTVRSGSSNFSHQDSGIGSLPVGATLGGAWHGAAMAVGANAVGGERPRFYIGNSTSLPSDPGTVTSGTPPTNTTVPLMIGGGGEIGIAGGVVRGIRHVAVFARTLTSSEVGALMSLARSEGIIT